ncbi:MAG: RtcB family protein [Armatimonadota bacterium]
MIPKSAFKQIEEFCYEIPPSFRDDMRVPARLYADESILEAALGDRSVEQLVNTTTLPGVVRYTLAMPDIHQGYGPPIGAVLPMAADSGVISPGATGYDINCGVRLLRTELTADVVRPHLEALVESLFRQVPSGVGRGGDVKVTGQEMDAVLVDGARWAIRQGYGQEEDIAHIEEQGSMAGAQPAAVSQQAKARGKDQLGTLGSGNHFIEVGEVQEIFDEATAKVYGLFAGQLVIWIHSGSRGLGHQVCTDYVKSFQSAMRAYEITVPDRELVCAPFTSPEGQQYFGAMAAAANYAWANRQILMHRVCQAFAISLPTKFSCAKLHLVYDVAHNIVKRERYEIDGVETEVIVHRKGATRAFGPGRTELPEEYRETGQPVLVPGDMGTASYVLAGTEEAMRKSFGSACHGAGRAMSRSAALKQGQGRELQERLRRQGIIVHGGSWQGLAEEAPEAYKDVNRVASVVHNAGLARKVARTEPLGVIKG